MNGQRGILRSNQPYSSGRVGSLAFAGTFLFLLVYYSRPYDWVPGLQGLPIAKVAGFFALGAFVAMMLLEASGTFSEIVRTPALGALFLLFVYFFLTVPGAVWPGGSFSLLTTRYWKVILITVLIALTANSLVRIRRLWWIPTLTVAYMSWTVYESYRAGRAVQNRISGPLGGVFDNPNDLALNIAVGIPLVVALSLTSRNRLAKFFWVSLCPLMACAIILTFSRGGFLVLMVAVSFLVWRLGIQGRRLPVVLMVAIGALLFVFFLLPAAYPDRLSTILDPASDSSGQARSALLERSLEVVAANPLLGIGPGNFAMVSGSWHGTHNTYLEFAAEGGIPSLLLFLFILGSTFRRLQWAIRGAENNDELRIYLQATQASLASVAVGCFFHSIAYHFFPYFIVGYALALSKPALAQAPEAAGTAVPRPSLAT